MSGVQAASPLDDLGGSGADVGFGPLHSTAPRSAPQADVAHGLAGGAALCGWQVDLAAGTDAHLVHGRPPGGPVGLLRVDTERETGQLNASGV